MPSSSGHIPHENESPLHAHTSVHQAFCILPIHLYRQANLPLRAPKSRAHRYPSSHPWKPLDEYNNFLFSPLQWLGLCRTSSLLDLFSPPLSWASFRMLCSFLSACYIHFIRFDNPKQLRFIILTSWKSESPLRRHGKIERLLMEDIKCQKKTVSSNDRSQKGARLLFLKSFEAKPLSSTLLENTAWPLLKLKNGIKTPLYSWLHYQTYSEMSLCCHLKSNSHW